MAWGHSHTHIRNQNHFIQRIPESPSSWDPYLQLEKQRLRWEIPSAVEGKCIWQTKIFVSLIWKSVMNAHNKNSVHSTPRRWYSPFFQMTVGCTEPGMSIESCNLNTTEAAWGTSQDQGQQDCTMKLWLGKKNTTYHLLHHLHTCMQMLYLCLLLIFSACLYITISLHFIFSYPVITVANFYSQERHVVNMLVLK